MNDDRKSAEYFLNLIKQSKRGKFKLYIGMIAGVGKTYRMLQEAHILPLLCGNEKEIDISFIKFSFLILFLPKLPLYFGEGDLRRNNVL